MNDVKYTYRRQFLLSRKPPRQRPGWNHIRVRHDLFLEVHPELEYCSVHGEDLELLLLGFALDPYRPASGNKEILQSIIERVNDYHSIPEATRHLGGRWVMIVIGGAGKYVFSDPCGLRSVFYAVSGPDHCCGSSPKIVAEEREESRLDHDAEAFIRSPYAVQDGEYWWPGDAAPFEGIARLLPNHMLVLGPNTPVRFWPLECRQKLSARDACAKAAALLRGLMLAAHHRQNLAVTLTAGIDSRTILAATRPISGSIHYYTMRIYNLSEESWDCRIPTQLLAEHGLAHHQIDCTGEVTDGVFHSLYEQNSYPSHSEWEKMAYGLYLAYPQDRLNVKGNVSEIGRCFYHPFYHPARVSAGSLAKLALMNDNSFALLHLDRWLRSAEASVREMDYRILDLFYWEQRCGSWQATNQAEWDIVQETFTPFNCRELLDTILGVDESMRRPPSYRFHREMIKLLWPELLNAPINPLPARSKLAQYAKHYGGRLRIVSAYLDQKY